MPRSTSEHQAQKIKSEHSPTISCSYLPLSPAQPVCPYSTPAIPLLCRKGQTSWLEHGWVCCRHCSPPPAQTTWLSSGGLGRRVEIRTQQPRGTNCYSHCTLCKAQEMGQEMAQLDITCAPLGTVWPLPGHCCSLKGQGWAQTASLPPQWMCPRSNVHTRVTKCWLNPHWHMPLIFQKLVGIEGRAQERWGLCQGENHPGCVHSVPSSPSSADQRSMGRVCCYLQCHLWAGEGKTHGLMVKHDPLNESLQSRLLGTENPSQVNKQAHVCHLSRATCPLDHWIQHVGQHLGTTNCFTQSAAPAEQCAEHSQHAARCTELKVSCGILHFTPTPSQPAKSAHSWWPRISFIPAQQWPWFTQWKM